MKFKKDSDVSMARLTVSGMCARAKRHVRLGHAPVTFSKFTCHLARGHIPFRNRNMYSKIAHKTFFDVSSCVSTCVIYYISQHKFVTFLK